MPEKKRKPYSQKHDANSLPDPVVGKELKKRKTSRGIPCALAFEIAGDLGVNPEEVGRAADMLDIPLAKCQLGLFGYQPEKKIIKAEDTTDPKLKDAVIGSSRDSRLSCEKAWQIADRFNISKQAVGNLCQAHRIKIKGCRLGAF